MNGRCTSLKDALIFRSIHFWCKMNCYTESFFLNCSLIAPSRLSDCMFIYCAIAPPWFILLYTFPLLIFPFCPSSNTNMKNFLVSQGVLTTFWRALSLGPVFPACDKQTGAFSSAFLPSCTPPAWLQQSSAQGKVWRSDPNYYSVSEELQNALRSKSVMWS